MINRPIPAGSNPQQSTPRTAVRAPRIRYFSLLLTLATANIALPRAAGETLTRVVGWGDNAQGQLAIPVKLSGVKAIAAGEAHALALKEDGTVIGWGDSLSGQSKPPSGLTTVEAIAAGGFHSLALKRDGTVVAWGLNSAGQCTIPANLGKVMGIAAGAAHSVALKSDGTVVAWGDNVAGQAKVPGNLSNIRAVYASGNWSGALKSTGFTATWGDAKDEPLVPHDFAIGDRIASNHEHGVLLKSNGLLSGFGRNSKCQTTIPEGIRKAIAVAVGKGFSLAILELEKQEIDFKPLVGLIYKKAPIPLSAESSAKLPLKLVSLTPAIADISDGKLRLHRSGALTITAIQEGNNQYAPASATQQVKVFPVPRHMTAFKPIGTVTLAANPSGVELEASVSEGNDAITFTSSNPKVARVEGRRLHILSTGVAQISAQAMETPQYGYAPPLTQTVEVKNPPTEELIKKLFANQSLKGNAKFKIGKNDTSDIDYGFAISMDGELFGRGTLFHGAEPKESEPATTPPPRRAESNAQVSGSIKGPVAFNVNQQGAIESAKAFISLRFSNGLHSDGSIVFSGGTLSMSGQVKTPTSGLSSVGVTSAQTSKTQVTTYSGLSTPIQKNTPQSLAK